MKKEQNLVILTTDDCISDGYRKTLEETLKMAAKETNTMFLTLFGDWKVIGNIPVKEILKITKEGNVVLKDIKEAR
jgi:hypothetical protein